MRFKLEYLSTGTVPYVLARQVDKGDFRVGPDSRLAGVRIKCPFLQPRAIRPDGSPDLTVFAFELLEREDGELLKVGETVDLIP